MMIRFDFIMNILLENSAYGILVQVKGGLETFPLLLELKLHVYSICWRGV